MSIHATAIIDENCKIDPSCEIGPYTVIREDVQMGPNNKIDAHCVLQGPMKIGKGNHFYPSCHIGLDPQYIGYRKQPSVVFIGNDNTFREMVQVHRSIKEKGQTRIGHGNFLMVNVHIAHDCILHDNIIMANNATLAGSVEIMENAFLSGFVGVVQSRKVGANALLSVHAKIVKDIPPYVISSGSNGMIVGLNLIGLKRSGIAQDDIEIIENLYNIFFKSGLSQKDAFEVAKGELDENNPYIKNFLDFIRESKNGIPAASFKLEPDII